MTSFFVEFELFLFFFKAKNSPLVPKQKLETPHQHLTQAQGGELLLGSLRERECREKKTERGF